MRSSDGSVPAGMADVYKAKDHKLNRFVAVKVLKQEFRKIRPLSPNSGWKPSRRQDSPIPNIVNVYDVGEDHGISYIVMELVEGITLKEYLTRRDGLQSARPPASRSRSPWGSRRPTGTASFTGM